MKIVDVLSLEVGDMVCDCRYRHLEVAAVEEVLFPKRGLGHILYWAPFWTHDLLERVWPRELVDKELTLADGSHCSASNCCDVIPHKYEHPVEPREEKRQECPATKSNNTLSTPKKGGKNERIPERVKPQ